MLGALKPFPEAVREAKEGAAEQFEIEKHNLMARNQKLENEVKNLKSLLSSDGEGSGIRPRMLSGFSDAVVGAIRRNTATSQTSSHDEEVVPGQTKSLEKSMEKVTSTASENSHSTTNLAAVTFITVNLHHV